MTYEWKRFWCPRGQAIHLDDWGFLPDPELPWSVFGNPNITSFATLATHPCLVLLGEPGTGKTSAMRAEFDTLSTQFVAEADQTIWVDLHSYSSEDRLLRDVFETQLFQSWLRGTHTLHIFLDSLDECLIRIDSVAAILLRELKKYPTDRLYLRVMCRSAVWPSLLEHGLNELWQGEQIGVYELVPLRFRDVQLAATSDGLDADRFIAEVRTRQVVPFAIKPVTLKFLLNAFSATGQLPQTQTDLYVQGCRLLSEESNISRQTPRLRGLLTAEQRMRVAARIATATTIGRKSAIGTGPNLGDILPEVLTISDICAAFESVSLTNPIEGTEPAIRESLDTSLFSSAGADMMGWSHQSYAEFLTAWYLHQRHMNLTQILSLLIYSGDSDGKVVPQLQGVAAWLASLDPTLFEELILRDPAAVLRGDIAAIEPQQRATLVDVLIRYVESGGILDIDPSSMILFNKLSYDGLEGQLRVYIGDRTKNIQVRLLAIDIGRVCEISALQGSFVNIVLDEGEPIELRTRAAMAISRFADTETRARLRPLVTVPIDADVSDQLKGNMLMATWPGIISIEEVLSALTPPRQPNYLGSYYAFLGQDFVSNLEPRYISQVLDWATSREQTPEQGGAFRNLIDALVLKAWAYFDAPGVRQSLAAFALTRLNNDSSLLSSLVDPGGQDFLSQNTTNRHALVLSLIEMVVDGDWDLVKLIAPPYALVTRGDVLWLLQQLNENYSESATDKVAELVSLVFDLEDPAQIDAVLTAREHSPILYAKTEHYFAAIEIGSPEARQMKLRHLQDLRNSLQHQPRLLQPTPLERVVSLLENCEADQVELWWQLSRDMTLAPDAKHYDRDFDLDVRDFPVWKEANEAIRIRIIATGWQYLMTGDAHTAEWLGTNTADFRAIAGVRALLLLQHERPDLFESLDESIWQRWCSAIIGSPRRMGDDGNKQHAMLIQKAFQIAPNELLDAAMIIVDKENRDFGSIFVLRELSSCWDERFEQRLLGKLETGALAPRAEADVLRVLLRHGSSQARRICEDRLALPLPTDEKRRSQALETALVLMTTAENAGWPLVWPAVVVDADFGRELITRVVRGNYERDSAILTKLSERQLGDLYIWLVGQFPPHEDPSSTNFTTLTMRELVADWRNSVPRLLSSRGTHESVQEIKRLIHECPAISGLKWILNDAEKTTRYRTWVPLLPKEILRLSENLESRIVQSGDQLLTVILESLRRLEAKLQGETPAAIFLWNETGSRKNIQYRPRDENHLSDFVKLHLEADLSQRGLVINREVEIRRGYGGTPGERTDILVSAFVRLPNGTTLDSVSAIIETKGCWNKDVDNAMRNQLVERYLKDNLCQHGLYLVGCFNCAQWAGDTQRRNRAMKHTRGLLSEQLANQAKQLSVGGMNIQACVINTSLRSDNTSLDIDAE